MANETILTMASKRQLAQGPISLSSKPTQGRRGRSRPASRSPPPQKSIRLRRRQDKKAALRRRAGAPTDITTAASTSSAIEVVVARITAGFCSGKADEAGDRGAEPQALPEHLRGIVPVFGACGRKNCSSHPEMQPWWPWLYPATTCCRCCRPGGSQDMHALPCGHALCAGCLEQAVATIEANVQSEGSWSDIAEHLEEHRAATENSSSSWPANNTTALGRAMEAAGFFCCGKNMRLERYLGCMEPGTAQAYWLAYEALRWPPDITRNRCGWPDCGQFVAPACSYGRDGGTVYHCVQCRGNSLVIRKGNLIPAR